MYNAQEAMALMKPPGFIDLQGQLHVGRHISILQSLELQRQYDQELSRTTAAGDAADWEAFFDVVRHILEMMELPAEKVIALPGDLFWAAMNNFFDAHRLPAPTPPPVPESSPTGPPMASPTSAPAPS